MSNLTVRKQRLRTLENQIRDRFESFVAVGVALIEIQDDRLYEEGGFKTWQEYLKIRVGDDFGIERAQAKDLIRCSHIRPKLPDKVTADGTPVAAELADWKIKQVLEFARLAPPKPENKSHYDFSRLLKNDVQRVAKAAMRASEETGKPLTSTMVRQAVDADIGPRKPKPKPKQTDDNGSNLDYYLEEKRSMIAAITIHLSRIPADWWTQQGDYTTKKAERLAVACDELAELLRS